MPPDPLSYNMSDVNPHLTRCEPPPYIKAGSAPAYQQCCYANLRHMIIPSKALSFQLIALYVQIIIMNKRDIVLYIPI